MTQIPLIPSSQDSRKNWKTINLLIRKVEDLERRLALLEGDPNRNRTRGFSFDYEPFRVYRVPDFLREESDRDGNDWRKFFVRHGYCNKFKTEGCDDADGEGVTPAEITVPTGKAAWYIWVKITISGTTVSAAVIENGETGWSGFPDSGASSGEAFRLLAKIDTATEEANQFALVRQFQRGDVFIDGTGGGGATWV